MRKHKLQEAEILGRKIKVGDILYAKKTDCPFKVTEIKSITINEDIFGLKENNISFTVQNLITGKETELCEQHMMLFKQ